MAEIRYTPTPEQIERECRKIRAEKRQGHVAPRKDVSAEEYEWHKRVYRDPGRFWGRKGLH